MAEMKKNLILSFILITIITLGACSESDMDHLYSDTSDLTGDWQLTMPAGFTQESRIEFIGKKRYRIPIKGNLGGIYEEQDNTLTMFNPGNDVRRHYIWQVEDQDNLILIEAPPVAKVGSDYRGEILSRL